MPEKQLYIAPSGWPGHPDGAVLQTFGFGFMSLTVERSSLQVPTGVEHYLQVGCIFLSNNIYS